MMDQIYATAAGSLHFDRSIHPNTNQPQRKKAYKKGIDQDDARRRREETQIQIRKNKREESLNQRRRTGE